MPAAAKLLADNNLSVSAVAGTGKDGRVTKGDVLGAVAAGAAKAVAPSAIPTGVPTKALPQVAAPSAAQNLGDRPEQRVPMSRLRARVAERLLQSQSTNAILTTFNEVNMAPVMDMRKKFQDAFTKEHGVKIGFMSFFVKAAVHALKKYPVINASVDGADIVYHLAAAVGVKLIIESPVRTIETNVKLTEIVLEAANKKKKPVFVASTSECYGKSEQFPFREEGDLVLGPSAKGRWSYACSKLLDEFLAIAYYRERRLPTVVARLFNTVGPRQTGQYGMVVPTFVKQALAGAPLTVYGDGKQSRCFTHVRDVVTALIALMQRPEAYGLSFWLRRGNLRFMAAAIPDPAQRLRTVDKLLGRNHSGAP